jgi:hypothetical protein
MRSNDLLAFIRAREMVRLAKEAGRPRPWTKNEILDTYRFCNVQREHDRVTRWIASNWREPNAGMPDLWFAMVVARLLNLPASLEAVGLPLPWKPKDFCAVLHKRKKAGLNNFNAAYIVSTNGFAMEKVEYLTNRVLNPIWADRARIRPAVGDTLEGFHRRLMDYDGMGSFMAAQVVADVKYAGALEYAADWHTWAAPGPGSMRGLSRVMELPVDSRWPGGSWLETLTKLRRKITPHISLHAQDLQNCLCEFDKYERVRLGEGRPKQLYKEKQDESN